MRQKTIIIALGLITINLFTGPAKVGAVEGTPSNLTECVKQLQESLPSDTMQKLKNGPESVVTELHLSLGTWVRNKWIRGQNSSVLVQSFAKMGVTNPDDISSIILTSLWRQLHSQPWRVDAQVAAIRKDNFYLAPQVTERRAIPAKLWTSDLKLFNEQTMKLQQLRGKAFLLLIVYLDNHSIAAVQAVNTLKQRFAANDLQAIAILHTRLTANDASKEEKTQFIKSSKPNFPVVIDEPSGFMDELRTALFAPGGMSLPETVLIDKDGLMITRFQDWYPEFEARLTNEVEKSLRLPSKKTGMQKRR